MTHRRPDASSSTTVFVLTVALLLLAGDRCAAQQDGQQASFDLGHTILSIAAGDLSGDGVDDLVAVVAAPLGILVFETQGFCTPPTVHAFPSPAGAHKVHIAELNGDGLADIVVTRPQMIGGVSVLTSTGATPIDFVTTHYPMLGPSTGHTAFQIVDCDGDGDLDLLSRYEALLNIGGTGAFTSSVFLPGPTILGPQQTLVWADVDGDGQAEVVVSTLDAAGVLRTHRAAYQPSSSSFGPLVTTTGPTLTPPTASLFLRSHRCDLNLDGFDDILVQAGGQQRYVFLGAATQALQTFVEAPGPDLLPDIVDPVGYDLDGDGQGELFSVSVDLGSAPATTPYDFALSGFTPSSASYPAVSPLYDVGDFNQDGFGDIAFADGPLLAASTLTIAFGGNAPILSLTRLSGPAALAYADGSTSPPYTLELRDCQGATVQGMPIDLTGLPTGVTLLGPTPLVTDALGRVSFQLVFPVLGGPDFELVLDAAFSNSVTLSFTRDLPTLVEIIDAPQDFVMLGRPETVRVRVTDAQSGLPLVGEPLTIIPNAGVDVPSGLAQTTDAQGIATFDLVTESLGLTFGLDVALTADLTIFDRVEFFGRGLDIPILPGGTALVRYRHESAGIPFLLAADLPLPAPGFVATPYGDVYTSVLAPTPGLATLTEVTGLHFFVTLPGGIDGLTFNVQVYGTDPSYPFPESIFISNPVTLSF